jgi:hypothetical protein
MVAAPAEPEPVLERETAEPEPAMVVEASGESRPAPEPRPADHVLEITEKPANPRRGWWQRLIQQ